VGPGGCHRAVTSWRPFVAIPSAVARTPQAARRLRGRLRLDHDGRLPERVACDSSPPDASFTQALALVSDRVRAGEDLRFAVREFLDEFSLLPRDDLRARAIRARPEPTGDPRADAYLGALAEHLAATHGIARPAWSVETGRFLDRFWFVSDVPGFRALAIAQSPAAFRRRGIFIADGALQRV
jgi:hypothetical protein